MSDMRKVLAVLDAVPEHRRMFLATVYGEKNNDAPHCVIGELIPACRGYKTVGIETLSANYEQVREQLQAIGLDVIDALTLQHANDRYNAPSSAKPSHHAALRWEYVYSYVKQWAETGVRPSLTSYLTTGEVSHGDPL